MKRRWALVTLFGLLAGWAFPKSPQEEIQAIKKAHKNDMREIPAGEVIKYFSHYAYHPDQCTSPCVIWVDPALRAREETRLQYYKNWEETAKGVSSQFGPYSLRLHDGFWELAWASPDREKAIRANMATETPPILFIAKALEDFPKMWEAVSGRPVDAAQMAEARDSAKKQPGRQDEPDIKVLFKDFEDPMLKEVLGGCSMKVLMTTEREPTSDFMKRLASQVGCSVAATGEGWVLRPLEKNPDTERLAWSFLRELKEDPYNGAGSLAAQSLIRMGPMVEPILLEELKHADSYYYNALLGILSRFPSKERDQAFLRELERWKNEKGDYLDHWYLETLINTLAVNEVREAIPLLQDYARGAGSCKKAEGYALRALDRLGEPLPERPGRSTVHFTTDQIPPDSLALYEDVSKALSSLADRNLLEMSGFFQVRTVERNGKGGLTVKGDCGKDTWYFETGAMQGRFLPVYYSYHCGSLCGAGFMGVLAKNDGAWTVRLWRQLWIS